MSNHQNAEVLVREGIRHGAASAVAPATHPIATTSDGHTFEILARIDGIRADLGAGNVEAAIRSAHLVGGRTARHGHRKVASLVRHAVRGARLGLLDGASDLLSQAHTELSTTTR